LNPVGKKASVLAGCDGPVASRRVIVWRLQTWLAERQGAIVAGAGALVFSLKRLAYDVRRSSKHVFRIRSMARAEISNRQGYLGLAAVLIVSVGPVARATGADQSHLIDIAGAEELIDVASGVVAEKSAARRGNPLWGITLRSLAETRERPIFAPSRRLNAPSGVAVVPHEPEPVAKRPEPEQPPFVLLGTVISPTESIGILLDQATNNTIRLRTGHGHLGWILRSLGRREAVLERNQTTAVLSLPSSSEQRPRELASDGGRIEPMAPWLRQMLTAATPSKTK
jgi:hypothetical protein